VIHEFSIGAFAPFRWKGFWWLFRQSLEGLYVWPLLLATLALVANLAVALIHRWPFDGERWQRQYWLVFLSLLFIPITIAVGEVGWIDPSVSPRPTPSTLLLWTNNGLFIASVVLGIFWVYRMKGLRWFALAFALIQLWMLFWASFSLRAWHLLETGFNGIRVLRGERFFSSFVVCDHCPDHPRSSSRDEPGGSGLASQLLDGTNGVSYTAPS
jgi:hypothetical protein